MKKKNFTRKVFYGQKEKEIIPHLEIFDVFQNHKSVEYKSETFKAFKSQKEHLT